MKNKGFLGVLLAALVMVSCNGNDPQKGVSDKVKTMEVTNIASRQVTMRGELKMEVEKFRSVEYGFIYTTDLKELKQHEGKWVQAYGLENGNEFSEEVSDLEPLTKYYVCTWVCLNGADYEYGEIVPFSTVEFVYHEHSFSLLSGEQVYFARGNLQYQPSTGTWRFAENPWDFVGQDNKRINDTSYVGWIDLFGWGTGDCPTKSSTNYADYTNFVDWGTNQIGTDEPNTWRTLSIQEWRHILFNRPRAEQLWAITQENNLNGLLLLPDDWEEPEGMTYPYENQDWSTLEAAGAVFLPAAMVWSNSYYYNTVGEYWSSSMCSLSGYDDYTFSSTVYFRSTGTIDYGTSSKNYESLSVRLVRDAR